MEKVAFRGTSREHLPVPGETLAEVLENRGISQKELAQRTECSEAFISQIINGRKKISATMARKLECVLDIEIEFWLNLQAAYDAALARLNEADGIDEKETAALKELHESRVDGFLSRSYPMPAYDEPEENTILAMRRALGVSALTKLGDVVAQGAFRMGEADAKASIMGAWLLIAKRMTDKALDHAFDMNRVPELIDRLKFELKSNSDGDNLQPRLEDIFSEYGIVFAVVPHFRGAPVQGYIAPIGSSGYRMVLTIRGARADRFWFTLFHELGHIVNGDDLDRSGGFVDLDTGSDAPQEQRADAFARQVLIDGDDYDRFVGDNDFSDLAIEEFAKRQNVPTWIVKGRLQRDGHVGWDRQSGMPRYKWAE